jgi:hypothetical protein
LWAGPAGEEERGYVGVPGFAGLEVASSDQLNQNGWHATAATSRSASKDIS